MPLAVSFLATWLRFANLRDGKHQQEARTRNVAAPHLNYGKSIQDFDLPKKPQRNKFAFACTILASMTSILLGYGNHN
ncbi:hypothetical protein CDL15_Pgr004236 [Punica granatum]|uniref:Uncharacterized protein n=1 Tax=Punica granatum TaxID=22663 RepID=A0A218XF15_PUNGR|nr:hypothetical protein CDL15_Pgr004236 [Punica granatum]PKI34685.1 hypothetical protein CRG98_044918 [Punica granatum]